MNGGNTIVAVSTPPGEGGLGVVRMSGVRAIPIGQRLFRSAPLLGERLRRVEYGRIFGPEGNPIDSGLAWAMKSPRTYTGEDTVEISCHGSQAVLDALLEAAVIHGASIAGPGEFTRRAFCNGRLDLLQAEAVLDLIRSASRYGIESAYGHASGRLSDLVKNLKESLVRALSRVEVTLDFSDEDIDPQDQTELLSIVEGVANRGRTLVDTFDGCRRRQQGVQIALVGRPNAGKSTLLNAFLGEERAIVTPEPGTTRDLVEGTTYWQGEPVRIVDTAGLRPASSAVEEEGIARARAAATDADLLLAVIDASCRWTTEDTQVMDLVQDKPGILVLNKTDLPRMCRVPEEYHAAPSAAISATTGKGLEELQIQAAALLPRPNLLDGVGITRARHRECLSVMITAAGHAWRMIRDREPEEVVAVELQTGLAALGDMLGEDVSEDVLDRIFADFCIGK